MLPPSQSAGAAGLSAEGPLIHLLIAEESLMNCQLLANAFTRTRLSFEIIACATSRNEILGSLKFKACDVALISETLSDGPLTGFQALREIRQSFPLVRAVMLLKSANQDLVLDAFRAGAKGIYCRSQPLTTLAKCVKAVSGGQVWADSAQTNLVFDAFARAAPLRSPELKKRNRTLLTKRESEVAKLLARDMNIREVAEQLGLTEQKANKCLSTIYRKLDISTRVELVLYWHKYHKFRESEE
jgi:DNA-binding NarL/FixJ family response regulator